jgi:peptide/nickel transport system ATP-binding protein
LKAAVPIVEARRLTRVFDVSAPLISRLIANEPRRTLIAVDGVDLAIARGETFGLVGESGSGKSTLARMVVGLIEPSRGQVMIDGVDLSETRDRAGRRAVRRRMQMIFQDPFASLNPRWRVGDIIGEPIRAFGAPDPGAAGSGRAVAARVDGLLELVGLHPADGRKFPHEFSGGQRQRIAIARAIAAEPDFIVCDEPTSALDVSIQAQILNLMRDLQERLGLTYLLITHNLAVVRFMATRVGVMYLGRLIEIGETDALFARPRHPYTRMLLDAVPDLSMSGRPRSAIGGEPPNPIDPPPGCPFHPRCPQAIAICRTERPAFRDNVACHLAAADQPGPAGDGDRHRGGG